jgi:hypothetical protein
VTFVTHSGAILDFALLKRDSMLISMSGTKRLQKILWSIMSSVPFGNKFSITTPIDRGQNQNQDSQYHCRRDPQELFDMRSGTHQSPD